MSRPRLRWIASAIVLVATLATGAKAPAAYLLEFGQTNYNVAANGTVNVSVFLRETGTTNLTTLGLIAGDLRLLFNEAPRVSQPAQVIARILNPNFDSPAPSQPSITSATASTSGIADILQSSFDPVLATGSRILLGQFTFQVGSTLGVVTQLRATDQSQTSDGLVLSDGTVIDTQTASGTATITVIGSAAVPEPTSLILIASAAPLVWLLRGRRRESGTSPKL